MTRKNTLIAAGIICSLLVASPAVHAENLVVVMADDLSTNMLQDALDAGLMPNLQTHVIDEGTTFSESFVTNALCCPSRATFLTGQYSHNHGVVTRVITESRVL